MMCMKIREKPNFVYLSSVDGVLEEVVDEEVV